MAKRIEARLEALEQILAAERGTPAITMTPEEAEHQRQRILRRLEVIETESEAQRVYGILARMSANE